MSGVPGARTLARRLWRPWAWLHGHRCRVDRPIFIVGCPRSGTTLFVRLFASHPALADWSEGVELWDAAWQGSSDDHVRTAAHASAAVRDRVTATVSLYLWLRHRRRFVNKLPRNALRIPYLAAIFPDCRVIHLIRDGRAVIASLMDKVRSEPERRGVPFGRFARPPGWQELLDRPQVEQFAHLWARLVPLAREAGRALPAGAYVEVLYEDVCRDPRGTLAGLYRWADLPEHPGLGSVPAALTPRNEKWLTTLSAPERALVERVLGARPEVPDDDLAQPARR